MNYTKHEKMLLILPDLLLIAGDSPRSRTKQVNSEPHTEEVLVDCDGIAYSKQLLAIENSPS